MNSFLKTYFEKDYLTPVDDYTNTNGNKFFIINNDCPQRAPYCCHLQV